MGDSGVHNDDIGRAAHVLASIAVNDLDISPLTQIPSSPAGERVVALDSGDYARWPDHFRQDGGVVAGPAADLNHAVTFLDIEDIEQACPQARQPVVQPAVFVDGYENVVIQVNWIGILGVPILTHNFTAYPPRTFTEEAFTGNGGKGA